MMGSAKWTLSGGAWPDTRLKARGGHFGGRSTLRTRGDQSTPEHPGEIWEDGTVRSSRGARPLLSSAVSRCHGTENLGVSCTLTRDSRKMDTGQADVKCCHAQHYEKIEGRSRSKDHTLPMSSDVGRESSCLPPFIMRGLGLADYRKLCPNLLSRTDRASHQHRPAMSHCRCDLDLEPCWGPASSLTGKQFAPVSEHIRTSSPKVATILLFLLIVTWTFASRSCLAQSTSQLGVNSSSPYSVQQTPPSSSSRPRPLRFPDVLYLGVLIPGNESLEINIKLVLPVMQIARERVKAIGILPKVRNITIVDRDSKSSAVDGPLAAMAMVKQGIVDAFFGPIVPNALSATALYCQEWDLPIFTTKGEATEFGDKSHEYKTLIRMMATYKNLAQAVVRLLQHFHISMAGLLLDTPDGTHSVSTCYNILKPVFDHLMVKSNKSFVDIYRGTFDDTRPMSQHNFTKLLELGSRKCRSKYSQRQLEGMVAGFEHNWRIS
ncbi:hypothetical protein RRG08_010857 [Elysia crispata]|uniref:Receptor ligand binding region domain-containing protein n=1 Tax=Elysia crispata TaxID=231223 RepID=A0AAE1CLR4_9GAST|nr:hypothetical protein RRG08_010857 [Elysia crispata]